MPDKQKSKEPVQYSHADVAVVFDVTRQAVYKWKSDAFTAEDIAALIQERQNEVDRIRARWEAIKRD